MPGQIYLMGADHGIVEMVEQPYESEKVLQRLLSDYPGLLAGDQMDADSPRRWLLVATEATIPGDESLAARWSADNLFLDQDGVPTIVEVKQSGNPELRRLVVGQVFEYATNFLAFRSVEWLQATVNAAAESAGVEADEYLSEFLRDELTAAEFWDRVKGNLDAGRIRIVFVADAIPSELRRIVEFLDSQMSPARISAVEVKQFSGGGETALVPRVVGQTARADARKSVSAGRTWNRESFFTNLTERRPLEEVEAALRMYEWMEEKNLRFSWGSGKVDGSFQGMLDTPGAIHYTFVVVSSGRTEMRFASMRGKPIFGDRNLRLELLGRINALPGVDLPEDAIERYPSVPLASFTTEDALNAFLGTMDWYVEAILKEQPDAS